jgi:uridine kinase
VVVLVTGVGGGTASGKSTVCNMIIQQLHDHRVVLVNQVHHSFYVAPFIQIIKPDTLRISATWLQASLQTLIGD